MIQRAKKISSSFSLRGTGRAKKCSLMEVFSHDENRTIKKTTANESSLLQKQRDMLTKNIFHVDHCSISDFHVVLQWSSFAMNVVNHRSTIFRPWHKSIQINQSYRRFDSVTRRDTSILECDRDRRWRYRKSIQQSSLTQNKWGEVKSDDIPTRKNKAMVILDPSMGGGGRNSRGGGIFLSEGGAAN